MYYLIFCLLNTVYEMLLATPINFENGILVLSGNEFVGFLHFYITVDYCFVAVGHSSVVAIGQYTEGRLINPTWWTH